MLEIVASCKFVGARTPTWAPTAIETRLESVFASWGRKIVIFGIFDGINRID